MIVKNVKEVEEMKRGHGDALYRVIFEGFKTKALSCWQTTVLPGDSLSAHQHPHQEQLYYILSGAGRISVGNEERNLETGDVVHLPSNVDHRFVNDAEEPCVFFAVGTRV